MVTTMVERGQLMLEVLGKGQEAGACLPLSLGIGPSKQEEELLEDV